ncbi:hypothetical protein [Paludisphaera soli]|uniref:hypothetical protein n=1 Tax=Paludisphaera soli TaxID=2712865 RepID=UPI0013ED2D9D|nr:hypothetical protein [Paludisphaera soli]
MSNFINAHQAEIRRVKPRKRKPVTLQALRNKRKPTTWLRGLISTLDFGVKLTRIGPEMQVSARPVHCNTNAEIIDALRLGDWHRIERLSNPMLDDHWNNRKTHYYTGNGSTRDRYTLVNIDIDCHASGSPDGAFEAAEYLEANFFPDLYHEPSTNGRGRHGYFILDTFDQAAEPVKGRLKALERCLNAHLLAQGFDIELCEIKGLPPVISWGDDGRISNYTAGILAKIPRQVARFDEWKRTTVLNEFGIRRLTTTLRSLTPEVASTETIAAQVESSPSRPKVSGSIGGKLIDEEELAQLSVDGHYRRVATTLIKSHVLKTSSRSVVTTEDVAAFLLLLKFFTNRMNADGTLPVKRFEGLWSGLYEAGDLGRSFDCHRFKAIRDYLSDLGLLDWEDKTYVVPMIDEAGKRQKGRACKWKAGESLMDMLDWEKWEEAGDESEGDQRGAAVVADGVHGRGRGEAPLVGTAQSPLPASGRFDEGVETKDYASMTISFVQLPPDHHTLRQVIQSLNPVADDRKIRPVEAAEVKPWRLSPEEVARLIPDFEQSIRLLAA